MRYFFLLILFIGCNAITVFSQQGKEYIAGDSLRLWRPSSNCKLPAWDYFIIPRIDQAVIMLEPEFIAAAPVEGTAKRPLLMMHGNVLYDYYNQGYADTPFVGKHYYQHTVQATIEMQYKEYPVKLSLNRTINNSPFIKSWTGFNIDFDVEGFKRNVRRRLTEELKRRINTDSLDILGKLMEQKRQQLAALPTGLRKQDLAQKQVEWNEYKLNHPQAGGMDLAGKGDSLEASWESLIRTQQVTDSLQADLRQWQDKYRRQKDAYEELYRSLEHYTNGNMAEEKIAPLLAQYGISDSVLPKGYPLLAGIKSLSIGKTLINYSELTAKNLLVSGMSVELSTKYYIAFSGGMIDSRFRDYFMPASTHSREYAVFARLGKQLWNGTEAVVTYYQGRKQLYNYYTSVQGRPPDFNLAGVSVLLRHRLSLHHTAGVEVARSSIPYYASQQQEGKIVRTLWASQHNMAYAFSFTSKFPSLQGSLRGTARYYGVNFQSFGFLNNGADQLGYRLQWEQTLLHRALTWGASVQKNSFSNPYVANTYAATTVFKSVYARYQHGRLPSLAISFSPSAQVVKMGEDQFRENMFYTFTASASHRYQAGEHAGTSTLLYSRFYNRAEDSGMVYFNSRNILLSNSCQAGKWTVQYNLYYALTKTDRLWTMENVYQWRLRDWLSVEAGCKWNRQVIETETLWGYRGGLRIRLLKWGELQGMVDRGYLPGIEKKLVKNNMGRITFTKTF